MKTEQGLESHTSILDGREGFRDEIIDDAESSERTIDVEGQQIDYFGLTLQRQDGTVLDNHAVIPESIILDEWDEASCLVAWTYDGPAAFCCTGAGVCGAFCRTGQHGGDIISVTYQEHTDNHGEGDDTFSINAGLNDAWVSADAPFQGFFFTVYESLGIFFLSWFSFDSVPSDEGVEAVFGAVDQRWVTGAGSYSGDSVTVSIELTSGGIFNGSEPVAVQQPAYGTINIIFFNCNEAVLTYNFPSVGLSGEITLTRVVDSNVELCVMLNDG